MPRLSPPISLNLTRWFALLAAALVLLSLNTAVAQRYTGASELMDAVNALAEPSSLQGKLQMTIVTSSGQSLSRELQMWARGTDERLMKFTAPADIAGSGFLQVSVSGRDDTFVYLPALGRTRRIAGGQQGESFFGSDFSYEDITGIEPDDYTHTLLEVLEGPIYVVEAVPTPESELTYDRLVLEVPEDTLVPRRAEYFRGGQLVKVLTVSTVSEIGGYLIPSERRMETIKGGEVTSYTLLTQTEVALDEDLPAELFTERYLTR